MPDRPDRLVRLLTYGFAVLLLVQFGRLILRCNPLARVVIPPVPTLSATNDAAVAMGTNLATTAKMADQGSNRRADLAARPGTNALKIGDSQKVTNSAGPVAKTTNTAPGLIGARASRTNQGPEFLAATNTLSEPNLTGPASNSPATAKAPGGTNLIAGASTTAPGMVPPLGLGRVRSGPSGFPGTGFGPGGRVPSLPPEIQARVDRIVESEIFAPVMRPLPMALLGIAGNVAFLRAANGQTGLVKENEELGGLKLLRIGINRVLVEEEGQKKELTIFSGLGGESLLPKPKDNP
jgi:hypothetical protein